MIFLVWYAKYKKFKFGTPNAYCLLHPLKKFEGKYHHLTILRVTGRV